MIHHVYPEEILFNPDASAERAILATLNINFKEINSVILNKIQG